MLEKNIGEVIAEAREKKGLSQRQLAKLAKINNSELSKIESGIRKDPSPKILRKISNIIDVNYSDLMYMIGLGLEVTQLNYFVKSHYASLNLEQLDTAEINVLGSIENSESIVSTCKKELEKDDLPEEQKDSKNRFIMFEIELKKGVNVSYPEKKLEACRPIKVALDTNPAPIFNKTKT